VKFTVVSEQGKEAVVAIRSFCVSSETATRSTAITVKTEEHLADEPHEGISI
jgi:hypothetical protein